MEKKRRWRVTVYVDAAPDVDGFALMQLVARVDTRDVGIKIVGTAVELVQNVEGPDA